MSSRKKRNRQQVCKDAVTAAPAAIHTLDNLSICGTVATFFTSPEALARLAKDGPHVLKAAQVTQGVVGVTSMIEAGKATRDLIQISRNSDTAYGTLDQAKLPSKLKRAIAAGLKILGNVTEAVGKAFVVYAVYCTERGDPSWNNQEFLAGFGASFFKGVLATIATAMLNPNNTTAHIQGVIGCACGLSSTVGMAINWLAEAPPAMWGAVVGTGVSCINNTIAAYRTFMGYNEPGQTTAMHTMGTA